MATLKILIDGLSLILAIVALLLAGIEYNSHKKTDMKSNYIKKRVLAIGIAIAFCSGMYAQTASYVLLESESSSNSNVRMRLVVYGKSKKTIDMEAQCAALRNVLFEGCPNTQYSKALMEDGEITSKEKYQQYFEVLFYRRYSDFIAFYESTSAFKKGDKKKGTEYVVEVKVLNLRKDLETNGVKRMIGL